MTHNEADFDNKEQARIFDLYRGCQPSAVEQTVLAKYWPDRKVADSAKADFLSGRDEVVFKGEEMRLVRGTDGGLYLFKSQHYIYAEIPKDDEHSVLEILR